MAYSKKPRATTERAVSAIDTSTGIKRRPKPFRAFSHEKQTGNDGAAHDTKHP